MDPVRVDLVALRRPIEYQFPNEKVFRIEPFRAHGKALLRAFRENPEGNLGLVLELLRLAVPGATDEDFDELSADEDVWRVLAAADGKAAQMEEFLKNGLSDGVLRAPSPTPPSAPTTSSSTSSDTSPEATASPGSTSGDSTGTTPSSPTPPSTKSSASKPSPKKAETSATASL